MQNQSATKIQALWRGYTYRTHDLLLSKTMPLILFDIQNYLKEYQIKINGNVEGEGRGGSLKDEGEVKNALMKHEVFQHHVKDVKARQFGDIHVVDYDKQRTHIVNIKTSTGNTDNCFSKIGFVYSLTDLSHTALPSSMNFDKMNKLINNNRPKNYDELKDYWSLCIDKNDSSQVIIRGARQINCWKVNINPSNILQVDWKKEKTLPPAIRTYDEAYAVMMGGVKESLNAFIKNIPSEWKD